MDTLDHLAFVILRIANGALYLNAAYACIKYWDSYTIQTTRVLIPDASEGMVKFLSGIGCMIMAIGGLTMVTGYFVRIGGLLLVGFIIGGTIIHYRLRNQVPELRAGVVPGFKNEIMQWEMLDAAVKNSTPKPRPLAMLDELTGSCYGAHNGEWIKNLVLLAISLFFVLDGWNSWYSLLH